MARDSQAALVAPNRFGLARAAAPPATDAMAPRRNLSLNSAAAEMSGKMPAMEPPEKDCEKLDASQTPVIVLPWRAGVDRRRPLKGAGGHGYLFRHLRGRDPA
jgi:hypothetical protein